MRLLRQAAAFLASASALIATAPAAAAGLIPFVYNPTTGATQALPATNTLKFDFATRTQLAAVPSPTDGQLAYLSETGREGWFKFSVANLSANVTNDAQACVYLPPSSATSGASGAWVRLHTEGNLRLSWCGVPADGSDHTAAFQAAINYALTLGTAKLDCDCGTYLVSTITLPSFAGSPWKTLELAGCAQPAMMFGTEGSFTLSTAGTVIRSTSTSANAILQVIGSSGSFSNYLLDVHDITFRLYDNPQINMINAIFSQQLIAYDLQLDTGIYGVQASLPTHITYGILTPEAGNAALTYLRNISVSGFYSGVLVSEHTDGDNINITSSVYGLTFLGAPHASHFGRVGVYNSVNGILMAGVAAFDISQFDTEHDPSGTFTYSTDIVDPSNEGVGNIRWWSVLGGSGPSSVFNKNGGTGIITSRLGT